MSLFVVPLHHSWEIKTLSRQRELDAQAEVLRGRRITAARKQRGVGLTIVVETHGEQLAQGVIGSEAELQGIVATAGTARHRSDVADDGCLLAETEVIGIIFVILHTEITNKKG